MAGFLNNLLEKNNPAKKLQKEIENIEFKMQSIITALQSDIGIEQRRIDEVLKKIGLAVYESHSSGTESDDSVLQDYYTEISKHMTVVQEKENKIAEFIARYEEEIGILKSSLSPAAMPEPPAAAIEAAPSADGPTTLCANCGMKYIPAEDIFCTGCGSKLQGD